MTQQQFLDEKSKAETFRKSGERPDYWAGYIRGLRRQYHGEKFGSFKEHTRWLSSVNDEWAEGYQAGFAYCPPKAAGV